MTEKKHKGDCRRDIVRRVIASALECNPEKLDEDKSLASFVKNNHRKDKSTDTIPVEIAYALEENTDLFAAGGTQEEVISDEVVARWNWPTTTIRDIIEEAVSLSDNCQPSPTIEANPAGGKKSSPDQKNDKHR